MVNGYIQYRCFLENCKDSHLILGVIPASFKAFFDTHVKKKRKHFQTNETPMSVEMDENDSVPVTEEDILHDTASPTTQDNDAVPTLLKHSNTRHRQILPFPHLNDANKQRMTGISDKFLK